MITTHNLVIKNTVTKKYFKAFMSSEEVEGDPTIIWTKNFKEALQIPSASAAIKIFIDYKKIFSELIIKNKLILIVTLPRNGEYNIGVKI